MDSLAVARMLVDINVPREELERLARGMTPAKLADVVGKLSALEIAFAYSKMRQRKAPGNQAHVTNAKDDPLQLAADAATAVALGFDEIETTMRVAGNAWSNALACTVGAAVGRRTLGFPLRRCLAARALGSVSGRRTARFGLVRHRWRDVDTRRRRWIRRAEPGSRR